MSKRQSCESANSGNDKMSTSRFLAKTVLPAPMKVIFRFEFFGVIKLKVHSTIGGTVIRFVLVLEHDDDIIRARGRLYTLTYLNRSFTSWLAALSVVAASAPFR